MLLLELSAAIAYLIIKPITVNSLIEAVLQIEARLE